MFKLGFKVLGGDRIKLVFLVILGKCAVNTTGTLFRCSTLGWNSAFFAFLSIIEGIAEKILQFIMQFKSIYNRNVRFIEQKMYFLNTTESQRDKLY